HDLIVVARRQERLASLAEKLENAHRVRVRVLAADLADETGIGAVETALAESETLTLLVNNAGMGAYRPFVQIDPAVAAAPIDVQVRATVRLTRAALPGMLKRGRGGVLNIASLLALSGTLPTNPLPPRAVYAGAKAFLVAFTQALAGELAGTKVRASVCLP